MIAENGARLCRNVFDVVSVYLEIRCYYDGFLLSIVDILIIRWVCAVSDGVNW